MLTSLTILSPQQLPPRLRGAPKVLFHQRSRQLVDEGEIAETAVSSCQEMDVATFDFSSVTNPLVAMEWTDASNVVHIGQTVIPPVTATAPFPGGSIRLRNVGTSHTSQAFDLLVKVNVPASYCTSHLSN